MAEGFNAEGASNYATFAANQCLDAADRAKETTTQMVLIAEEANARSSTALERADKAVTDSGTACEVATSANSVSQQASEAVSSIVAGEAMRVENEDARILAEAKRAAQFAEILDSIQGAQIRILSSDEYDENGVPTIDGAPGTLYFVPIVGTVHNTFTEWAYINGGWEVIGTTNTTIKGIDTDTIDRIVAGETVAGDEVVKTTGLSYLWACAKKFFAEKIHTHGASGIENKAITGEKIADGAVGQNQLDSTVWNSISQTDRGSLVSSIEGNRTITTPVNFRKAFSVAPVVIAGFGMTIGNNEGGARFAANLAVSASNITPTGFDLNVSYYGTSPGASSANFRWIAIDNQA